MGAASCHHLPLPKLNGNVIVIKVQDPANLEKVKIGDTIVITYTEALAIAVRPVKK